MILFEDTVDIEGTSKSVDKELQVGDTAKEDQKIDTDIEERPEEEVHGDFDVSVEEFYTDILNFCAENNIDLTESAIEEIENSGVFTEAAEEEDFSSSILEFCVENGIQLSSEQIENLKNR